jgi:hypothetical protein
MPSLTYTELAAALKIAPESANRLARRRRWPRTKGNDGRMRVTVPEEALARPLDSAGDRPLVSPGDSPSDSPPDNPVHAQIARLDRELAHAQIARMEGELAGLREALTAARARADAAEAQLAATDARADKQTADFAVRDAQRLAELEAERLRTEKAITAFAALARRLEAMAEAKRPSWWRWLRFAD